MDHILIERRAVLGGRTVKPEEIGYLYTAEKLAHAFRIVCEDAGGLTTLTGNVTAYFRRDDGNTILIQGSLDEGRALVVLPQDCYNIPGRFGLVIYHTLSGATTVIWACRGTVLQTQSGALIDSGEAVPDLSDLLAAVVDVQQATDDANEAAAKVEAFIDAVNDYEMSPAWTRGGLNTSGNETSANTRIRTGFIAKGDAWDVTPDSGVKVTFRLYSAAETTGAFVWSDSNWHTDSVNAQELFADHPTANYIRVMGALTDDSTIAADSVSTVGGMIHITGIGHTSELREVDGLLRKGKGSAQVTDNGISWRYSTDTNDCYLKITGTVSYWAENVSATLTAEALYAQAAVINDRDVVRVNPNDSSELQGRGFALVYDAKDSATPLKLIAYSTARTNARYTILFAHSYDNLPCRGLLTIPGLDAQMRAVTAEASNNTATLTGYLSGAVGWGTVLKWELGGIKTTGADTYVTDRIRTGYYRKEMLATVTPDEGAKVSLRLYSAEDPSSFVWTSDWYTSAVDIQSKFASHTTASYVRLVACYDPSETVTDVDDLAGMIHNTVLNTAASIRSQADSNTRAIAALEEGKADAPDKGMADYFAGEALTCRDALEAACTEPCYVVGFVTDSHYYGYSGGNNWPRTAQNMAYTASLYPFDCVIHGGDITTGNLAKASTVRDTRTVRKSLTDHFSRIAMLTGNHDDNSYKSSFDASADWLDKEAQFALYGRMPSAGARYLDGYNACWWDVEGLGLRIICLDAVIPGKYGNNGITGNTGCWGYSPDEIAWLTETLATAKSLGLQVAVFSHMPASGSLMNGTLTGSADVCAAVNSFVSGGGTFVGWFHGHTHRDKLSVVSGNSFHECATGCSVCNDSVTEATDELGTRPAREPETVTEDLWDIVVIKPGSRVVNLVRFGAGSDRTYSYGS
ncbi:MAG: metallophosphoesterase [Clostridia bacterium]|nr:metallophosphoesterase [Clostridia bacterium]